MINVVIMKISFANANDITWSDGSKGANYIVSSLTEDTEVTATYNGISYPFTLHVMGGGTYPIDATGLIINPDFATIDGTGWTMTGTWGNQRFNGAVEVWHSTNFDFSQTISGLPDGEYTVTCQLVYGEGSKTGYLYATSGSETSRTTVKQSCAGSDFDTQRDRMAANSNYARLSVTVNVTGGILTIGIKDTSSGTNWLVWDNFTLTCNSTPATGISEVINCQTANSQCFDLQGRRVNGAPQHGIYIIDGKKFTMNFCTKARLEKMLGEQMGFAPFKAAEVANTVAPKLNEEQQRFFYAAVCTYIAFSVVTVQNTATHMWTDTFMSASRHMRACTYVRRRVLNRNKERGEK